jgi:TM2 domain-containing membrane protein YozV
LNKNKDNIMKKHITFLIAAFLLLGYNAKAGHPYSTQKAPKLLKAQSPTVIVMDIPGLIITPSSIVDKPEKVNLPKAENPVSIVVAGTNLKEIAIKSELTVTSSSSYVPSAKEQRNAKRINKKLEKAASKGEAEPKSSLLAAALCWFFGIIGVHRFYLGYTFIGILQIFTLGGLGIWTLIDFILILTGDLKPKKGSYKGTVTEEMDELFN